MRASRPNRRVPLLAALQVLFLLAAAGAFAGSAGAAPRPTATQIGDVFVTGQAVPVGAPGNPDVLVVAGTPFSVEVVFTDADGKPLPASYNKDTTVTLSVVDADPDHPSDGSVSFVSGDSLIVPAGAASSGPVSFTLTAGNRVKLHAAVTDGSRDAKALLTSHSFDFDVVVSATEVTSPDVTALSTTGDTSGEPCVVTESDPYCADLYLPSGSVSGALLSLGLCDSFYCGSSDRPLLQFLADLDPALYGSERPATVVYRCDKSVCGQGGIPSFPVFASLSPTGALALAEACETKGVVNAGASFCVDYKQSTRDNAGDLYLVVLFGMDGRVSAG